MGRDKARKPRRARNLGPASAGQEAQQRYHRAMEASAAAETGHVQAVEAVIETKAAITVLQAEQAVAQAVADDADRGLEAIRRIRAALPALHALWERFPGLPPEEKFTAAGMTLADVGLADGDLEILASIPRGTT